MNPIKPLLTAIICIFFLQSHSQTKEWIWIKGDNIVDQTGIYSPLGVSSASNKPGSRYGSASWTDASGNLWLFGGEGYDVAGLYADFLSDLWKYDPISNQWTWVKGDNTIHQYGVYGTKGVANMANKPGSRYESVTWTDGAGNFWLFGGVGYAASGGTGLLNDLWKYDPSSNQWTWISGDNVVGQKATYGTLGVANAANKPGSRIESVSWIDGSGALWLFGGVGYVASGTTGLLNDLWKYDPASNQWTWVNGDNIIGQIGVYGIQGTIAASNKPGSRKLSISWTDASGNFWLFGGTGNAVTTNGELNDLWKYNPSVNQWTWMKGDNLAGMDGIYGTQGVSSNTNIPRSRYGGVSWKDKIGNLWMFGGWGSTTSGSGYLSDLWEYDPASNQWVWVRGPNAYNQIGIYGTQGTSAAGNNPGGRWDATSWTDHLGNLWLFGGVGYDALNNSDKLNDLWQYNLACTSSINIAASTNNICQGTSVTFTATPTLPGTSPVYQWQKNGSNVGTNSNTYTDAALNNGDVIACKMTSNEPCVGLPNVSSNSITMTVNTSALPAVTITASSASICSGSSVTFTATNTNGGTTPAYQWQKNGTNVGANTRTYTDALLNNNDVVRCILTSSLSCVFTPTATSNSIVITVKTLPTISINASAVSICAGTLVNFTATISNSSGIASYQWKVNGGNVGSNSPVYSSVSLANGDIVTCNYSDNSVCMTASGINSNSIPIQVSSPVTPAITISASATNICSNTSVTFSAASSIATASYQWKKNGVNVGTNSSTYTDNSLSSGDNISCVLTATGGCLVSSTAVSNIIRINIFPDPVVTLDPTPVVCTGTNLDAGTFSSYLWNDGSTSRTITVTNPGTYSVQVTDNNGCKANGSTAITNVLPIPSSFLASETVLNCETQSATLSSLQIFPSYLWSTGETSSQVNVFNHGTYWLEATNSYGCKAKEYITVKPGVCPIIIPNTFTPNNDSKNDLWIIKGLERHSNCTIEVFNRYGQIVFHSTGYSTPWNGTFNNKSLSVGTYYYILDLKNGTPPLKGFVTIIK
jgi:gliding motility-associated-like protein